MTPFRHRHAVSISWLVAVAAVVALTPLIGPAAAAAEPAMTYYSYLRYQKPDSTDWGFCEIVGEQARLPDGRYLAQVVFSLSPELKKRLLQYPQLPIDSGDTWAAIRVGWSVNSGQVKKIDDLDIEDAAQQKPRSLWQASEDSIDFPPQFGDIFAPLGQQKVTPNMLLRRLCGSGDKESRPTNDAAIWHVERIIGNVRKVGKATDSDIEHILLFLDPRRPKSEEYETGFQALSIFAKMEGAFIRAGYVDDPGPDHLVLFRLFRGQMADAANRIGQTVSQTPPGGLPEPEPVSAADIFLFLLVIIACFGGYREWSRLEGAFIRFQQSYDADLRSRKHLDAAIAKKISDVRKISEKEERRRSEFERRIGDLEGSLRDLQYTLNRLISSSPPDPHTTNSNAESLEPWSSPDPSVSDRYADDFPRRPIAAPTPEEVRPNGGETGTFRPQRIGPTPGSAPDPGPAPRRAATEPGFGDRIARNRPSREPVSPAPPQVEVPAGFRFTDAMADRLQQLGMVLHAPEARRDLETCRTPEQFAERLLAGYVPPNQSASFYEGLGVWFGELSDGTVELVLPMRDSRVLHDEHTVTAERRVEKGGTNRVVDVIRPGLRVRGEVVRKAEVVMSV